MLSSIKISRKIFLPKSVADVDMISLQTTPYRMLKIIIKNIAIKITYNYRIHKLYMHTDLQVSRYAYLLRNFIFHIHCLDISHNLNIHIYSYCCQHEAIFTY